MKQIVLMTLVFFYSCTIYCQHLLKMEAIPYYSLSTYPYFTAYTNYDNDQHCFIEIEQDSTSILNEKVTFNTMCDHIIAFPKIIFDTIIKPYNQIIPISLRIEVVILFNLNSRRTLFSPSYIGTVNSEEIISIEDLNTIQKYAWNIISRCRFYIHTESKDLCIPKYPIECRFDINVSN